MAAAQGGVVLQYQGAAAQGRVAGEVVGAAQGEGIGTGLVQAASAGDFPRQGQVAGAGQGQVAIELDQVAQGPCGGGIQRPRADDAGGDGHAPDVAKGAQGQLAAVDEQATADIVGGVQGHVAAVDEQAAADGVGRAQGHVASVDGQAAGESVGSAESQVAAVADQTAAEAVGIAQGQVAAGTCLGQGAGAADQAAEGHGAGVVHREVGAVEVDAVGHRHRPGGRQGAGTGDVEALGAEPGDVAEGDGAARQGGAAGEVVGAAEGQVAGAGLGQGTTAGEHAAQRQGIGAGGDRQAVGAEGDAVAHRRVEGRRTEATTVGGDAGAGQGGAIDVEQAATEQHGRADGIVVEQLVGQRPGTASDHQVVEVEVVAAVDAAGIRLAGVGVQLQVQGVAVVQGAAIDEPGGGIVDAQADDARQVEGNAAALVHRRPGAGVEAVGQTAHPQVNATVDGAVVGEGVADAADRYGLHRHPTGDGAGAGVGQDVPGAAAHGDYRDVFERDREPLQDVATDGSAVLEGRTAVGTVLDDQCVAGQTAQQTARQGQGGAHQHAGRQVAHRHRAAG